MLKKVGGKMLPPILQIRPLKMDHFYYFAQKGPQKRSHNSARWTFFSKKLTYDCSSALKDEVPEEKRRLISKTAVPQQFC